MTADIVVAIFVAIFIGGPIFILFASILMAKRISHTWKNLDNKLKK